MKVLLCEPFCALVENTQGSDTDDCVTNLLTITGTDYFLDKCSSKGREITFCADLMDLSNRRGVVVEEFCPGPAEPLIKLAKNQGNPYKRLFYSPRIEMDCVMMSPFLFPAIVNTQFQTAKPKGYELHMIWNDEFDGEFSGKNIFNPDETVTCMMDEMVGNEFVFLDDQGVMMIDIDAGSLATMIDLLKQEKFSEIQITVPIPEYQLCKSADTPNEEVEVVGSYLIPGLMTAENKQDVRVRLLSK